MSGNFNENFQNKQELKTRTVRNSSQPMEATMLKKCLILIALVFLSVQPSMALISDTAHDLSSGSTATIKGDDNELCVYCHTPHGGQTGGIAPLWNRADPGNITAVYDSSTLSTVADAVVAADVDNTDAPLCLSCHDGTNVGGNLTNPPGLPGTQPTISGGPISAGADIDLDLSDDHPIGFNYATAVTQDTELNAKASVETALGAGAVSFGGGDDMWCSSCHDVHGVDDGSGTAIHEAFLRISNDGSALCLACHDK
jgi:cytochrome c553